MRDQFFEGAGVTEIRLVVVIIGRAVVRPVTEITQAGVAVVRGPRRALQREERGAP